MSLTTNRYQEHCPSPQLAGFVECYWTVRSSGGWSSVILPDGCIDLIIDTRDGNITSRIVGTMTHALALASGEKRETIAVRFRPGGAWALLGISPIDLVDAIVPLEALLQQPGPRLQDLPQRIALLELDRWLLSRMSDVNIRTHETARVARVCINFRGCNVADLADFLGMSRQHLRRQVLAATGVGPKELSRIGRMRRLSESIAAGTVPTAKVAMRAGYFDQAHMANEFRRLSGMTPSSYAKSLRGL